MKDFFFTTLCAVVTVLALGCKDDEPMPPAPKNFTLTSVSLDGLPQSFRYVNVSLNPRVVIDFSEPIELSSAQSSIVLSEPKQDVPLTIELANNDSTIVITPSTPLNYLTSYTLFIAGTLKSVRNQEFGSQSAIKLITGIDPVDKFPRMSDEALLDTVQRRTFKYFYNFAHPTSGMARERNTSGDIVTSGGSGFGIMAIIVGIERSFITRDQAMSHFHKIISFLETADRFHGAWPHWLNGSTGKVVPFSANDNGGDLVETSFLIQGLLTLRQYLNPSIAAEKNLIDRINALWEGVEWDWYTRGGQKVLYWHWSPDKQWTMNHQIRGYNEALITYVLAASSTTHSIDKATYEQGWANNGAIRNGKLFYGTTLPVGFDLGGPLFFAHYSFLGLDPRNLEDQYANYWTQNVNHSKINYLYAADNPKNFAGYSEDSWGLTASDNQAGYSAHSPTNDLGVITPSAALSSIPYTPEESLRAMRYFYYKLGDRLWGPYGFYDAFNLNEPWFANSYLAIDQGPIIVMIENHRTGKLWDLFMSAPEVRAGLTKLSFTY
ncbi:MAG TPA: glucoamylase family protein [Chryseosolibacter sp.]